MALTTVVGTAELERHLADPGWVVVDCRFTLTDPEAGRRAYAAAHIPGARYVHLDEDLSAEVKATTGRHPLPDRDGLRQLLGRLGVGPETQVVVYDDSFGAIAVRFWWLLRWLGHGAVALLDGGLPKWRREKRPVTDALPQITPAHLPLRPSLASAVTADEVVAALAAGGLVVDARAEARFLGIVEPLDRVKGHIPGTVNRPFEDNLAPDGTLSPATELRDQFIELLDGREPSEVIHMCGSGVTACHNTLAMEIAGLPGARLYAGSWSEWITDSSRPVATGG